MKIKPWKSIKVKWIFFTLLMVFVFTTVLIIQNFVILRNLWENQSKQIEHNLETYNKGSTKIIEELGQRNITLVARQTAAHIADYIKFTGKTIQELQKDSYFRQLALRTVGKSGYCCLYEKETAIMRIHPNPKLINKNLVDYKAERPDWWRVFSPSLNGRECRGSYKWKDKDQDQVFRLKYMVMTPVKGTNYMLAATTYIEDFSESVTKFQTESFANNETMMNQYKEEMTNTTLFNISIGLLIIFVFEGIFIWLTVKNIIYPITRLSTTINRMGKGDLAIRTDIKTSDEIGELAENFNNMANSLTQSFLKLEESEEKYRSIFENAVEGIFQATPEGRFTSANPSMASIFGYDSPDDLVENVRNIREQIHVNPQRRDEMISTLITEKQVKGFEAEYYRKDGKRIWGSLNVLPVFDNGKLLFLEGTLIDISKRKEAEFQFKKLTEELEVHIRERTEQLEATNKELEAFSYSVSHDLRAPLRAIDGFSLALLEDYGDQLDDDGKDYLQRVRLASQRMANLIDDMLKLSRLTRGDMYPGEINLSEMALGILEELQSSQPDRKVQCNISPDVIAYGDFRLLRAAMSNLLANAWKFTGKIEQPVIDFGVKKEKGNTVYFIKDNGAGFDMDYADKLFGTFQRLHSFGEFDGTGVGLAIVQRVFHRHGGNVWAEATVNQGAAFYFTL